MSTVEKCFIGRVNQLAALLKPRTCAANHLPSFFVSGSTASYCMIEVQLIQQHHNVDGVDPMDPVVVGSIVKRNSSEENGTLQFKLCKQSSKTDPHVIPQDLFLYYISAVSVKKLTPHS